MTKKLKTALDAAIMGYIKAFEKKHGVAFEWARLDDLTGMLCFGDHFFNMSDVVQDIDKKYQRGEIFNWQDDGVRYHFEGGDKVINLSSYMRGLRYT